MKVQENIAVNEETERENNSRKAAYRMEMKGYSCGIKDDGGSFRGWKYEMKQRHGGRSDAQDRG